MISGLASSSLYLGCSSIQRRRISIDTIGFMAIQTVKNSSTFSPRRTIAWELLNWKEVVPDDIKSYANEGRDNPPSLIVKH